MLNSWVKWITKICIYQTSFTIQIVLLNNHNFQGQRERRDLVGRVSDIQKDSKPPSDLKNYPGHLFTLGKSLLNVNRKHENFKTHLGLNDHHLPNTLNTVNYFFPEIISFDMSFLFNFDEVWNFCFKLFSWYFFKIMWYIRYINSFRKAFNNLFYIVCVFFF